MLSTNRLKFSATVLRILASIQYLIATSPPPRGPGQKYLHVLPRRCPLVMTAHLQTWSTVSLLRTARLTTHRQTKQVLGKLTSELPTKREADTCGRGR